MIIKVKSILSKTLLGRYYAESRIGYPVTGEPLLKFLQDYADIANPDVKMQKADIERISKYLYKKILRHSIRLRHECAISPKPKNEYREIAAQLEKIGLKHLTAKTRFDHVIFIETVINMAHVDYIFILSHLFNAPPVSGSKITKFVLDYLHGPRTL